MNRNYFIMVVFAFFAFNGANNQGKHANLSAGKQNNHFANVVEVKQFGDTARLEIEKNGNVYIKHYIDLKKQGFDNSYTATCIYSEMPCANALQADFHFGIGDFVLYFDKYRIIRFCDSMLNNHDDVATQKYYKHLKLYAQGILDIQFYDFEESLMQDFNCRIINRENRKLQKSLLIESYCTDFSGGKNYYIISQSNDTIPFFHRNQYMK